MKHQSLPKNADGVELSIRFKPDAETVSRQEVDLIMSVWDQVIREIESLEVVAQTRSSSNI